MHSCPKAMKLPVVMDTDKEGCCTTSFAVYVINTIVVLRFNGSCRGQTVTVHCTGYGKDLSKEFWSTRDPGQVQHDDFSAKLE